MGFLPTTDEVSRTLRTSSGLARSTLSLFVVGTILLSCLVSQGLAKNGEVVTNSFYVKINADKNHPDPGGLAHKIARRNGFHNLGPVSRPFFTCISKANLGSISPTCLCAAFTCTGPKSIKIQSSHQYLFALLESAGVNAVVNLTQGLEQRFSTQITPRPAFYHNLGPGRKAILYGSLSGWFYLPASNKKGLKVFKNVYIWVDFIFCKKYHINWPFRLILYFRLRNTGLESISGI